MPLDIPKRHVRINFSLTHTRTHTFYMVYTSKHIPYESSVCSLCVQNFPLFDFRTTDVKVINYLLWTLWLLLRIIALLRSVFGMSALVFTTSFCLTQTYIRCWKLHQLFVYVCNKIRVPLIFIRKRRKHKFAKLLVVSEIYEMFIYYIASVCTLANIFVL